VALNDTGRRAQARRELDAALARHPNDRDLLLALTLFERDAGNRARALALAERLSLLEPDSRDVQQLLGELRGGR
jgi:tetratricopeptide (TPR) repeat protein